MSEKENELEGRPETAPEVTEESAVPQEPIAPEEHAAPEEPENAAGSTPENTAEEKPAETPPLNGLTLSLALCDEVLASAGPHTFHGGVRPDNISVADNRVVLGGPLVHSVGEFTPQELEYMAPELFWDGIRTPASDVYSIGLVMYAVYNYGRLPFWPSSGAITPNARASALQKRMSAETIQRPAKANDEVADVILRSLAFRTEERWQDVRELRDELAMCGMEIDSPDIELAVTGLLNRGAEARAAQERKKAAEKTYYDEGEIPNRRPPRRHRSLSWIWILLLLAFIAGALVLLLSSCHGEKMNPPTLPNEPQSVPGIQTVTPTPGVTPEPTASPTPEATATPTGARYVAYREDVSWNEAVRRCEELGGTLAMPHDADELEEISRRAREIGLTYVWLGAARLDDGGDRWVTPEGEEVAYFFWGEDEPSYVDGGDGAAENYMLLWRIDEDWYGNDSRENPLQEFGYVYSGAIGFVCQMW